VAIIKHILYLITAPENHTVVR